MNEFFKKPIVKILMLKGEKGDKGNTGTGTPKGGKTGQYLLKKSNADYDYVWSPITTVSWDNVSGKTNATTSASGLMSAEDKAKLDELNNDGPNVLHEYVSRPTSANNIPGNDRKLKWFVSSGSLTEGKPLNDGYIIQFSWDGASWPSQLYIPSGSLGKRVTPQFRMYDSNKKVWDKWVNIYSEYLPQSSVTKSFTLSASSWNSGSYTISDSLITATSNQEILPATSITADQMKALQKANIIDSGQSAGSLTLKALGTVPTIDIPIRVIFRGTI